MSKRLKVLVALAVLVPVTLVALRLFGLVIPFLVPQKSMTPAIAAGGRTIMEGFTYLTRKPARGDIVVFRAKGIPHLEDGVTYVKRVVGLPGERIRISDGTLYINESIVELKNNDGVIRYANWPGSTYLSSSNDSVVIPEGDYFLLGDNSSDSLDSRFWGFLPAKSIRGRMWFTYWPPQNIGVIK
jgi:signal peptidase I